MKDLVCPDRPPAAARRRTACAVADEQLETREMLDHCAFKRAAFEFHVGVGFRAIFGARLDRIRRLAGLRRRMAIVPEPSVATPCPQQAKAFRFVSGFGHAGVLQLS